jgi:hypothetical protein
MVDKYNKDADLEVSAAIKNGASVVELLPKLNKDTKDINTYPYVSGGVLWFGSDRVMPHDCGVYLSSIVSMEFDVDKLIFMQGGSKKVAVYSDQSFYDKCRALWEKCCKEISNGGCPSPIAASLGFSTRHTYNMVTVEIGGQSIPVDHIISMGYWPYSRMLEYSYFDQDMSVIRQDCQSSCTRDKYDEISKVWGESQAIKYKRIRANYDSPK